MSDRTQAMRKALDALCMVGGQLPPKVCMETVHPAVDDLRRAIEAEPTDAKPVARVVALDNTPSVRLEWASVEAAHNARPGPLFAWPTTRPLTREQIDAVMTEHYPPDSLLRENVDAFEACVRDIERLHCIGGNHG